MIVLPNEKSWWTDRVTYTSRLDLGEGYNLQLEGFWRFSATQTSVMKGFEDFWPSQPSIMNDFEGFQQHKFELWRIWRFSTFQPSIMNDFEGLWLSQTSILKGFEGFWFCILQARLFYEGFLNLQKNNFWRIWFF